MDHTSLIEIKTFSTIRHYRIVEKDFIVYCINGHAISAWKNDDLEVVEWMFILSTRGLLGKKMYTFV